jgi:chemotaxis protein methyltransferase CheR
VANATAEEIGMGRLAFRTVKANFRSQNSLRIQQGETYAGPEKQGTILKSCICVGFYHPDKHIGAISHITGFGQGVGHSPRGALAEMRKGLKRHGLAPADCECFILGGADRVRHVYESVVAELKTQGIHKYEELDLLGAWHRKFEFNPATGQLTLFKKSNQEIAQEARKGFSSDRSYECFHDPKRRLITGASLFFRNEPMLKLLREQAFPDILNMGNRLHVWCAGCSLGMETYSVAMVALDWLSKQKNSGVDLKILGSDISKEALATANQGVYAISEKGAQTHKALFARYTERLDTNKVRVTPELRSTISFKQRDIQQGSRKHLFELAICDHVMQYFDDGIQLEMLAPLVKAIQPGGFAYISSPSNIIRATITAEYGFECLARSFYRKPITPSPGM